MDSKQRDGVSITEMGKTECIGLEGKARSSVADILFEILVRYVSENENRTLDMNSDFRREIQAGDINEAVFNPMVVFKTLRLIRLTRDECRQSPGVLQS